MSGGPSPGFGRAGARLGSSGAACPPSAIPKPHPFPGEAAGAAALRFVPPGLPRSPLLPWAEVGSLQAWPFHPVSYSREIASCYSLGKDEQNHPSRSIPWLPGRPLVGFCGAEVRAGHSLPLEAGGTGHSDVLRFLPRRGFFGNSSVSVLRAVCVLCGGNLPKI